MERGRGGTTPQSACASRLPPSHRNVPSGHSGVAVGLFPQRVRSTLCSKTLDLQVRCARPAGTGEPWNLPDKRWNGEGGQPLSLARRQTAPPFAPKRLFGTFRCCAWLIPYRQRTALSVGKRSCSRFAALTLRVSSHRNDPSGHSGVPHGLFSDSAPTHLRCAGVPLGLFGKPKRSSFSRIRGLHQAILWPLLQNAHASGSLRSPCGDRGAKLRVLMPPLCKGRCRTDEGRLTEGLPLSREITLGTTTPQSACASQLPPSHRNGFSSRSGVTVGLFSAKSTQYSLLQNARPSGSLCEPEG